MRWIVLELIEDVQALVAGRGAVDEQLAQLAGVGEQSEPGIRESGQKWRHFSRSVLASLEILVFSS